MNEMPVEIWKKGKNEELPIIQYDERRGEDKQIAGIKKQRLSESFLPLVKLLVNQSA